MSDEIGHLVAETAQHIFEGKLDTAARLRAEGGTFLGEIWDEIADAGLAVALAPEAAGGSGLTPGDIFELVKTIGYHAVPLPLAETLIAHWVVGRAGLTAPSGPLSIASVRDGTSLQSQREGQGWRLRGRIKRVPWGGSVATVAVALDHAEGPLLALLDPRACKVEANVNLALEPRDDLLVDLLLDDKAVALGPVTPMELHALGAAMRSMTLAGALEQILAMTTAYALQRKQFGQVIGKFQAIRQYLAIMAGQSAAATAAARLAGSACAETVDPFVIGIAKARCGEAAGIVAALAHQIHGAIGFTHEHSLHFFTKRLWSWRDEFGNENEWNERVGMTAAAAGADGYWPLIAAN